MRNYFEKDNNTRKSKSGKRQTSSLYFIYWIGMSILVSILASSCAYSKPNSGFIGAIFLLVGQMMYPTLERYYGGLGTGVANAAAQITRYADGIIGIGLFFGCGINMLLG